MSLLRASHFSQKLLTICPVNRYQKRVPIYGTYLRYLRIYLRVLPLGIYAIYESIYGRSLYLFTLYAHSYSA